MIKNKQNPLDRRTFIRSAGSWATGVAFLPGYLLTSNGNQTNILTPIKNRWTDLYEGLGTEPTNWWEQEPLRIVEMQNGFEFSEKSEILSDLGANMEHLVRFNDTSPGTAFLLNHGLFPGKSVDFSSLEAYLNETAKKNLRVVIYYNVHAIETSYAIQHPQWQQVMDNGEPIKAVYGIDSSFCINSPWREEVFRTLRRLASYKIAGVFYDGPIFFANTCSCASCKSLFRQQYQKELPSKSDISARRNTEEWRQLLEFQSDSIARFLRDSNKVLKEINPQLLLYMNGNTLAPTWPTGRSNRKIIAASDILGAEGGFLYGELSESIYKPGASAKLLECQASGKPTVIFNAAKQGPWSVSMLPQGEISLLYSQSITHQGNVWLAVCDDPRSYPAQMAVIRKYNQLIKDHPEPFFQTKSLARIALVWPHESSDYYLGSSVPMTDFTEQMSSAKGGNLSEEFYGFYEGLSRGHIPFDVLDEISLEETLDQYECIIFPNVTCLSQQAVRNIKSYVRNGGNIIATFETSLYDEFGEELDNFQLAEVFGMEHTGSVFGTLRKDFISLEDHSHFSVQQINQRFTYAPTYGLKLKAGSDTHIPVVYCKPLPGRYAGAPEPSMHPFLAEHHYGKGTSVYISGTFGGSLYKFHFPEYYQILHNLVRELHAPVVRLHDAPTSVEVNVRRNGDAYFVYLINFTSDMRRPIQSIIPCADIGVEFHIDAKVKSVRTLWRKKELKFKTQDNWVRVELDVLEDYDVLEFRV